MTTTETEVEQPETPEEADDPIDETAEDGAIDVPSFVVPLPGEEERPATAVVETPEPEEAAILAVVDDPPPGELEAFPSGDEFRTLLTMARVLADSNLVPRDLHRKPHDVLLVLLTGRELGISPTSALRSCYVVDGKVTLAPALKQAIVTDRGLGKVRPAPGNNAEQATWIAFEKDGRGGWVEAGRLTLTMAEMETAQNGNRGRLVDKDNWQSYPARMLSARCRGWLVDDIWPEAAFGLYSPDEVGAFTDEHGEPIDVASYENVPDGYRQAEPPPPETIAAEDVDALTARISALPSAAAVELRSKWKQAKYRGGPIGKLEVGMEAGAFRMAAAVLSGVESMVKAGRFPADEVTVCDGCEKPDPECICPPPEDGPASEPEQAEIVYGPGEEPFD